MKSTFLLEVEMVSNSPLPPASETGAGGCGGWIILRYGRKGSIRGSSLEQGNYKKLKLAGKRQTFHLGPRVTSQALGTPNTSQRVLTEVFQSGHLWLMPIVLAAQEAEMRRITVRSQVWASSL
jgi:hypothetical protein